MVILCVNLLLFDLYICGPYMLFFFSCPPPVPYANPSYDKYNPLHGEKTKCFCNYLGTSTKVLKDQCVAISPIWIPKEQDPQSLNVRGSLGVSL